LFNAGADNANVALRDFSPAAAARIGYRRSHVDRICLPVICKRGNTDGRRRYFQVRIRERRIAGPVAE